MLNDGLFHRSDSRALLIPRPDVSHANMLFPLPAAAADAGDAAEDPGSDAHSEGSVLTRDSASDPHPRPPVEH